MDEWRGDTLEYGELTEKYSDNALHRLASLRTRGVFQTIITCGSRSGYGTIQPGLSATDWHLHVFNTGFNHQFITNLYGATSQFSHCCMRRWWRAPHCLSWCGLGSTTPRCCCGAASAPPGRRRPGFGPRLTSAFGRATAPLPGGSSGNELRRSPDRRLSGLLNTLTSAAQI